MSESDQRQKVFDALRCFQAFSVENPCRPGTPDVAYRHGWIELKWDAHWPKRETTPLTIPHYTKHQRLFHRTKWMAGWNMYLLLQVGRDWLLFDGETAANIVGLVPRNELIAKAMHHWVSSAEMKRNLPQCLQRAT